MYSHQLKRIEAEVARTNELLREQQRLAALSPEERAKKERRRREAEARESNDRWRIKQAEQAEADRKRKKRDRVFAFFGALAAIILYANGLQSLGIILGIFCGVECVAPIHRRCNSESPRQDVRVLRGIGRYHSGGGRADGPRRPSRRRCLYHRGA
jgi:hypothetical protein